MKIIPFSGQKCYEVTFYHTILVILAGKKHHLGKTLRVGEVRAAARRVPDVELHGWARGWSAVLEFDSYFHRDT